MVVLQKADTNLDEVVNDVNNLVNCTHCHGLFSLSFLCVCVCVCVCVLTYNACVYVCMSCVCVCVCVCV